MGKAERLQKLIAAAGLASRRRAEDLIRRGRVTVNGAVVTEMGTKADPESDHIKVDGKLLQPPAGRVYLLLNKPRGVICTVSDPRGRTSVVDLVRSGGKLFPVGRLDYNTEGLILLTNDGDFAKTVAEAGDRFPKVYHVKVRATPDEQVLSLLREGARLRDGTILAPCFIRLLKAGNNSWFEVTLTQGRNRQIRKMFGEFGHPVSKLRRVRIGFLTDEGLPVGASRPLSPVEVSRILRSGPGASPKPRGAISGKLRGRKNFRAHPSRRRPTGHH